MGNDTFVKATCLGQTPQVVAASMVLSAALSLQLQYHPFVDAGHNFLESIGLHACLVQLLVALLSNTVGKIDGDTLDEVSTAVLVLTMFGSSLFFFGWMLGGTAGLGTVIFALGIGPAVALGIYFVNKNFK